jgi:hypothetical protein
VQIKHKTLQPKSLAGGFWLISNTPFVTQSALWRLKDADHEKPTRVRARELRCFAGEETPTSSREDAQCRRHTSHRTPRHLLTAPERSRAARAERRSRAEVGTRAWPRCGSRLQTCQTRHLRCLRWPMADGSSNLRGTPAPAPTRPVAAAEGGKGKVRRPPWLRRARTRASHQPPSPIGRFLRLRGSVLFAVGRCAVAGGGTLAATARCHAPRPRRFGVVNRALPEPRCAVCVAPPTAARSRVGLVGSTRCAGRLDCGPRQPREKYLPRFIHSPSSSALTRASERSIAQNIAGLAIPYLKRTEKKLDLLTTKTLSPDRSPEVLRVSLRVHESGRDQPP